MRTHHDPSSHNDRWLMSQRLEPHVRARGETAAEVQAAMEAILIAPTIDQAAQETSTARAALGKVAPPLMTPLRKRLSSILVSDVLCHE